MPPMQSADNIRMKNILLFNEFTSEQFMQQYVNRVALVAPYDQHEMGLLLFQER